jgi:hypothetical protein
MSSVDGSRFAKGNLTWWRWVGCGLLFGLLIQSIETAGPDEVREQGSAARRARLIDRRLRPRARKVIAEAKRRRLKDRLAISPKKINNDRSGPTPPWMSN